MHRIFYPDPYTMAKEVAGYVRHHLNKSEPLEGTKAKAISDAFDRIYFNFNGIEAKVSDYV